MTVSEDFFQINQLIPLCFNPHILFFPSNQDISPLSKGNGNGKEERDSFQGAKQTKISPRCALFSSNLEITLIRSITIGASFPLSFPRRVAYLFMRISPAARGGAGTTRLQRKREERSVFRGYCSLWNRIGGTWRADAAIYAAHARTHAMNTGFKGKPFPSAPRISREGGFPRIRSAILASPENFLCWKAVSSSPIPLTISSSLKDEGFLFFSSRWF